MRIWITGWITNNGGHGGYTYDATKKEAMERLRRNLLPMRGLSKEEREDSGLSDLSGFYVDAGCELDAVSNSGLHMAVEPLSRKKGNLRQFIGYADCPGLGKRGLEYLSTFGSHADNGLD